MSRKMQTFTSILTNPHNIHRFHVSIPSISGNITLLVKSVDYPAQGPLSEIPLYYQGEKITYPGQPRELGGKWEVSIPEADNGAVEAEFRKLLSNMYNQKTGSFTPRRWDNVTVFSEDLEGNVVFSCILHGAWLQNKDKKQLSGEDPSRIWEWRYTFVYQWLEDLDINSVNRSNNPMV